MTTAERDELLARVGAVAADGRYEINKTTQIYDGAAGKVAHGFAK